MTEASTPTALSDNEIQQRLAELGSDWSVNEQRQLSRTYTFPDFAQALALVNKLGDLAERRNHHPDFFLAWGRVTVVLWTHDIGGLSDRDFRMAAEIDQATSS